MKNISFSELSDAVDLLESRDRKGDLPLLADCVAVAKTATDRVGKLWDRLKTICKDRDITEAKSDNVQIRASYRAGGARYNAELLDAYFSKAKIDPNKFKKPVADSLVITIEQI